MSEKIQLHNLSAHDFEQCLKCSICTVYCPVSAVEPNYPGPKHAGPDLMRYRMKDPDFFNETLKLCLNCKRCEVACPHG
ncbi:MAG TPA: anaerobic glycerol-3-phosphate dehydrogenase subunit C, partial [Prevotella sp.]|nr:anaerobic glycerol-3-phosphate dehydrogenase subunit C [Prevotella sp.]